MAASTLTSPATKRGGLALIVGTILVIIASFLQPGLLIDPVDQVDFPEAIRAMADAASLAHFVTMLTIIGMLLYIYAALTLLRLPQQHGALRLGIFLSMFGWSLAIVGMGMRHLTVHLMQRGMGAGAEQAAFESLALNVYVAMGGVLLTVIAIYPIASFFTGLGLASRFGSMNIFKLASYALVAVGVLASINFLVFQHASDVDPIQLLMVNVALQWVGSLGLFIIAVGMYRGQSELTSED